MTSVLHFTQSMSGNRTSKIYSDFLAEINLTLRFHQSPLRAYQNVQLIL